jgi:hypothetical protein
MIWSARPNFILTGGFLFGKARYRWFLGMLSERFLSLMNHPAFSGGFFVSFSLGKRMKKKNDKPKNP